MWPNPQFSADFIIFSGEILNGKLYFLCSGVNEIIKIYQQINQMNVMYFFAVLNI